MNLSDERSASSGVCKPKFQKISHNRLCRRPPASPPAAYLEILTVRTRNDEPVPFTARLPEGILGRDGLDLNLAKDAAAELPGSRDHPQGFVWM